MPVRVTLNNHVCTGLEAVDGLTLPSEHERVTSLEAVESDHDLTRSRILSKAVRGLHGRPDRKFGAVSSDSVDDDPGHLAGRLESVGSTAAKVPKLCRN